MPVGFLCVPGNALAEPRIGPFGEQQNRALRRLHDDPILMYLQWKHNNWWPGGNEMMPLREHMMYGRGCGVLEWGVMIRQVQDTEQEGLA